MPIMALCLTKNRPDTVAIELQSLTIEALPTENVLVKIDYSSLNYKDALAITNRAPIARISPLVLGIDCAGTVIESKDRRYKKGDAVMVNGFGVGERYWGGMAQLMRFNGNWLTPLPAGLTCWQAMALGTAGYTAALAMLRLEKLDAIAEPDAALVTGATGGIGSIAAVLLAQRGFKVTACTAKANKHDYLQRLGIHEIWDRSRLNQAGKPLQPERFAVAIDCLGSHTLANVCAQMRYQGVVAACGLAQDMAFPATVAPFILRGITLAGIDSVQAPPAVRRAAWALLAREIKGDFLLAITTTITLSEVVAAAKQMIAGQHLGRVVIDVNS